MSTQTLAPTLRNACRRWPKTPAVTFHGDTLTYAQLWQRVGALTAAYRRLGIGPGNRVVCQLPTCPELLIAANAAWGCQAVHVGVDKDLTGTELAAVAERVDAAAVVVQPPSSLADPAESVRAVRHARPSIPVVVHNGLANDDAHALADLLETPAEEPADPPGPDDTALLLLTSGTTGTPKVVQETLPALWAKVGFFADEVAPGPDDVHLMYLPLAHAFGLKLSLMALASGGRLVLLDRFTPDAALQLAAGERVTVLPGTPTHLRLLLNALESAPDSLETVRWLITAAAPLPPPLVERLTARLEAQLFNVYGCSEGFLTCTADPDDVRRGSVGRRVFQGPPGSPPDGSVAILHPETDAPLAAGEVGQVAYGAHRPVRYWDEPPVATAGWYRSGDLGYLDDDGRLYVTGRLKDVINRGGLKVAPAEIDAVLCQHPDVADGAVVATPDDVLGEAICACVVPAGPEVPTLAELRDYLRQSLARHKLPDELCALDAIPRSKIGKLDRQALARHVAERPRLRLRHREPTWSRH